MTPQHDVAYRLIQHAARSAPGALAERLEEEWLADLASRSGAASRLRLAIGCCWATTVIARDFAVPQVVTSGAGGGVRTLWGGPHHGLPRLSRRTATFVMIAAVHLLLIYGFASGLAQQAAESLPPLMHGVVIQDTQPQRPVPPVPTLSDKSLVTEKFSPDLGPIEHFDFTPDSTGPQVTLGPSGTNVLPPPAPAVERVPGGPGAGFPNTDDFYPTASRRLAETGATTVQVCVNAQGRLTGEPSVAQSSGIRRLDEGALNLARAGSGHYRPATENGRPVSSCYAYRIRFRLAD